MMYIGDNRDQLAVNGNTGFQPGGTANGPTPGVDPQWCPGQMQKGVSPSGQQTNLNWPMAGQIYPNVGNPTVYRCPADPSTYAHSDIYPTGGAGARGFAVCP